VAVACGIVGLGRPVAAWGQEPPAQSEPQAEPRIRFDYDQQEWKTLIEWFAEQADLSLQPIDEPPPGTFTYRDDREYTVAEAMDVLNHALMMRGYSLVRNGKMLVLVNRQEGIPQGLIEEVSPDQLDQRGYYEVVKTVFDVQGLDPAAIRQEIEPLVAEEHRGSLSLVASANQLMVQETAGNLRTIRRIIEGARNSIGRNQMSVEFVELVNSTPEEVMLIARPLMGIAANAFRTEDGSFHVSVDPLSTKIFFTGTPERVAQFKRVVEMVEKSSAGADEVVLEPPYFRAYAVRGDPELMHGVLDAMLAGRGDVQLDHDSNTGMIYVRGRTDVHNIVEEVIGKTQDSRETFVVIETKFIDPDELVTQLQTLFKMDATGETPVEGPTFYADSLNNRVAIRGTPQEVAAVQDMVNKLDVDVSLSSVRQTVRHIPLGGSETDRSLDIIEQLWPTLQLDNSIEVVMPGERTFHFDSTRQMFEEHGLDSNGAEGPSPATPPATSRPDSKQSNEAAPPRGAALQPRDSSRWVAGWLSPRVALAGHLAWRGPQAETPPTAQPPAADEAQTEPPTVPGAPIRVRVTDYGIVLESEDLDALDRLERLIIDQLGDPSLTARPTFFFLKYRGAEEAKMMLESYLGISGSDSSGGGSALGNLLGGAIQNAVGDTAGDMLGGLLGGGGASGSSAGAIETEGPVSIVADERLQSLLVSASANDMAIVRQLVDYIDRPEPPQAPNNVGESYVIPIRYRNPAEIEEIVRQQFGELIVSAGGGPVDAQAAQMQAQQEMLRALLQGGRGRGQGGGSSEEIEKAKATLSVDVSSSSLVVTGPRFIYEQINLLVNQLDRPTSAADEAIEIIRLDGRVSPEIARRTVAGLLGDKVVTSQPTGTTSGSTVSQPPTTTQGQGRTVVPGLDPGQLEALQRQMRQQAQQRGRGGRQGGRGDGGGGGGNGGGGNGGGGGQQNRPGGGGR